MRIEQPNIPILPEGDDNVEKPEAESSRQGILSIADELVDAAQELKISSEHNYIGPELAESRPSAEHNYIGPELAERLDDLAKKIRE